jgi:hypothetical protein
MKINDVELDQFTLAYIEAALWSSNDESNEQGGEPLDCNYDIHDIDVDTLRKMKEDCEKFQRENWDAIAEADDLTQPGHDFWLSRCGHGCGFFDRDCYNGKEDELQEIARKWGEVYLYVGDDHKIYGD